MIVIAAIERIGTWFDGTFSMRSPAVKLEERLRADKPLVLEFFRNLGDRCTIGNRDGNFCVLLGQ